MADRAISECAQCGQQDDHPKVHLQGFEDGQPGVVSKHHDCLSAREESMVRASSDEAAAIIDACKGGKRGPKLLAHIQGA